MMRPLLCAGSLIATLPADERAALTRSLAQTGLGPRVLRVVQP
jgi:hypothetical protein